MSCRSVKPYVLSVCLSQNSFFNWKIHSFVIYPYCLFFFFFWWTVLKLLKAFSSYNVVSSGEAELGFKSSVYENTSVAFLSFFLTTWFICCGSAGSLLLCMALFVVCGRSSSSQCTGVSLQWLLLLQSTGSRVPASVVVGTGFSCPEAREIFLDQGSNLCPLNWQADSYPTRPRRKSQVLSLQED